MVGFAIALMWLVIAAVGVLVLRQSLDRQRALSRLEDTRFPEPQSQSLSPESARQALALGTSQDRSDVYTPSLEGGARRLRRTWWWLPWTAGLALGLTLLLATSWREEFVASICVVLALLANQFEGFLHARRVARLEVQLADSIDIMVGALGAGAAVGPAIEAAISEVDPPLRPYLEEVSGRIRLGDEPLGVFRSLADRVPLETFLLFSSALAVHWEVGGRLAPTLASVGRTIRDRIEINRRIQSNIAQSQFSTFAILGLIYFIALIVWRNGPEQMREFIATPAGGWFVAGSIVLQAVGIAWMNLISKPKF